MESKASITVTLGDIAPLVYGKALPERVRSSDGTVRVYGSNGVVGTHDKPLTKGETVVVGRKGTVGAVHYSAGPCWPIDTTFFVEGTPDYPTRFLYYLLSSVGLEHMNSDSAVPGLNRSVAHARLVSVPSTREERERIAHILGTLDDKIELNRRMNQTLEEMARALFKSWFVDFDPVRAKAEGRDTVLPNHLVDLFPDRLVDSELGEIPEGWGVEPLARQLTVLETGGRPKGGVSMYETGVPSIGAESIVGLGVHDFSKTKYVPREFFDKMKRGHLADRDVLLYKDGGRPGLFEPHVTMVGDGFPFEECAINEHVYRIRVGSALGQNYLFFWLSSEAAMEEMRIKGTGVAIPGLNSTGVKSLTTLVPASAVVRAFDDLVVPVMGRVLAGCKESLALSELRDELLARLLSPAAKAVNVEAEAFGV